MKETVVLMLSPSYTPRVHSVVFHGVHTVNIVKGLLASCNKPFKGVIRSTEVQIVETSFTKIHSFTVGFQEVYFDSQLLIHV